MKHKNLYRDIVTLKNYCEEILKDLHNEVKNDG